MVHHNNRVMRQGNPATDVFIIMHPELPNKEFYATQNMVQIIEEGPE